MGYAAVKRNAMKAESLIPASWFYMDDSERIKLNWFLYEYALVLFEHIKESRKKALTKWKLLQSDEQIAEFSAYYAKRMAQSIRALREGSEKAILMPEYYVSDYCHSATHRENRAIMEIACAAWTEKIHICNECGGGCTNDGETRCEFFGRMERGECHS
jgi:hypothetical protein